MVNYIIDQKWKRPNLVNDVAKNGDCELQKGILSYVLPINMGNLFHVKSKLGQSFSYSET